METRLGPTLFCPQCNKFIREEPRCPQCSWEREAEEAAPAGQEVWRFVAGDKLYAAPTIHQDTLYLDTEDGVLHAPDARPEEQRTPKELWRYPLPEHWLPTEAEWEKAAQGTGGRTYSWGEGIDCDHAQYNECGVQAVPVGSKPQGVSPYGALDMVGNVWEWVADWYDGDYYSQSPEHNPPGPDSGTSKVLRGGSWYDDALFVRGAYRIGNPIDYRDFNVGFRCARGSQ
jgi:hypothetical protein